VELTVSVGGGELWAEDTGGGGTPLVLVHGDWTDSGIWSPLTRLLRDRYRMIRYDLRGFGRSSRPAGPFTRLDDLHAVLDHRDVARAVVVGHSGGGGTALGLALAAPERVSELILIAPGVHDYPWPADDRYFREASSLIKAGDHDGLVRLGLRTWAAAGPDEEVTREFRGAVSSWSAVREFERADPPAFGRLGEVTAPAVMVIGGLEYPMVTTVSTAIADRVPGCETILLPQADHLLPLRCPARLADVISETRR
jgi:3-oxoadipate enol-lactonase